MLSEGLESGGSGCFSEVGELVESSRCAAEIGSEHLLFQKTVLEYVISNTSDLFLGM